MLKVWWKILASYRSLIEYLMLLSVAKSLKIDQHLSMLGFLYFPRDAMLARVFATATCLSVCPSVCPSVRLSVCHGPV